ncbi:helix-turn-helix domain-containing protein [Proteiniborus sp. MB09-C3]|uniref:GH39 family glycosyl hydrolase n=1 Tax=Proteiniborus sp. MB09-C3 TaxID=3050072 RepID=UPI002553BD47|nr:helix-turn-helix domain-containing protein [Proteiniborus sp. MB09-C3]WIV12347.1 helix-turn-helix domain-containing protein [Proteiniborus sp. MB09-C3]
MGHKYEIVKRQEGFPIKAFIHSINRFEMHWHNEIEILLVLQGSVNIRVGNDRFLLSENDLILINRNEIHNTSKTEEDNIILALQINPEYYSSHYPQIGKMVFQCKSFLHGDDKQERFDIIRHYLAQIVWELSKKREGYQLTIGSIIYLLAAHLVDNFDYTLIESEKIASMSKDIDRIQGIINYINENLERKVSLKELSDNQNLSVYYLSHFIKKNMGMTFQEYLNNIRLDKAVNLLSMPDKTITEISYESGFSSTKSFNKLFKNTYGCTPTDYRKKYEDKINITKNSGEELERIKSKTYLDVDRSAAFKKLLSYLKPLDNKTPDNNMPSVSSEVIFADASSQGEKYKSYWKKLTTFSRASEGLRQSWQNQLKELQAYIGFEYIRFHGVFSDDMMVYNIDEEGNVIYNWSYVDELFDFFKKVNIKPFVELSFMPSEIKSSDEVMFWWRANVSQPRDIKLWTNLVKEFIKHCINRYGLKEVETWYFEVWNEPDLEYVFWIGGKESYFQFYKETVLAIKSISPNLKVGGPSITHQITMDSTWLEDYLIYCDTNKIPLDFVSLHIYPESFSSKEQVQDIMIEANLGKNPVELMTVWQLLTRIYYDKHHTYDILTSANDRINKFLPYRPELHITEWNASSYCRNLINDTCFVSTFIISNVLKNIGKADSIGFWTFTDIMEESKAGISAFHGGFGLINKNGLKKPSYFAYYLLSKLGDRIIEQGEEHIVTKKGEDIQVLAYNYAYFDDLFLNGDTSALSNTERYLVFEDKPSKEIELNINGPLGYYKIIRYQLNREHGSVVDAWISMGAPENMTEEELKYLQGKAYPKITVQYLELDGKYKDKLHIPVHGAELIVLEKRVK